MPGSGPSAAIPSPRTAGPTELPALINGTPVGTEELVVPAIDPGFLRGDGVFEVIRLYEGVALAAEEHLERLHRSAAALALDYDPRALEEECTQLCSMLGAGDVYIRLVVTRLGRRLAIAENPIDFPPVMRLRPITHAVSPLMNGVKALSYAANCQAQRMAEADGYDDALLVDPASQILELPFASFACVIDGALSLPPLEMGILNSITRRILTEAVEVDVCAYGLEELGGATEACVIGTGMEVCPVAEVANVGTFNPNGPVVAEAAQALHERIEDRLSSERRFRSPAAG